MTYQKKAPDKNLGRPPTLHVKDSFRFATSAEMGRQLREACEKSGIPITDFCRQAVEEKLKNKRR